MLNRAGAMHKCRQCGGKLQRVHRTFVERFNYMAIFVCAGCERIESAPYRFRYHLGPACRCPICGTYRVVRLKQRDHIDRVHTGFLNLLERVLGGNRLYHCRWCRMQFYDRRKLAGQIPSFQSPGSHPEISAAADTEPAK
jgi:hypothetical protein